MHLNVLVAEPCNDTWAAVSDALRRYAPAASVLRVKDGQQATRFLFDRGLLTAEPQVPDLVVLAASLPFVDSALIVSQLRQKDRTRCTPVILLQKADFPEPGSKLQEPLRAPVLILTLAGNGAQESQLRGALQAALCLPKNRAT